MKQLRFILVFAIFLLGYNSKAQGPSYYDLTFKADSITNPYKTANSNYAYVRSKRGTDGLNPTSSADSVKGFSISKIVLVYTEVSPDDIANREEYNQERWENLIMTYPEFFQAKTVYQNMCQCTENGGSDEYKSVQGFYIYYVPKGGVTTAPVKKAEPVSVKTENVTKTEPVQTETKKTEAPVTKTDAPASKVETPVAKVETPAATPVAKTEEPVVKSEPKAEEPKKEVVKESESYSDDGESTSKKKSSAPAMKPRKAKDAKACRPACYGGGDDDLNAYFKDNVKLSKKQKKKWKGDACDLKISLNVDGSIKKAAVAGANADLNKMILDAANAMNTWNAAVKNGVTIKSEVRITLKFDKETKSFKPFTIVVNPRPNPKCKCMSDSDMFGD